MSPKWKKIWIFLGKVILVTLLIVLFIRYFFVESFTISSSHMESSLHEGDRILINKTAYGLRLPVTVLSVPLTFDSILGGRSYSEAISIPYKRLFENTVGRNDVVLFNNPLETSKPLDKRSLMISRCVALPDDTIGMRRNTFSINGKPYIHSPNYMEEYVFTKSDKNEISKVLTELDFPLRYNGMNRDSIYIQLSRYEAFLLKENLPDSISVSPKEQITQDYELIIPFRGKIIDTDKVNVNIYKQIITEEQKERNVSIENGILLIDGTAQRYYTFTDNYYWMVSDNSDNRSDSRSVGFVSSEHIVGKASYIWKSKEKGFGFSRVE